jgi:hypothetical protein
VVGPVDDLERVSCADIAGLDHAQIRAGPCGLREPLDPAVALQPALEGAARDPRARHLQDDVRPDPPTLTDQGAVDVQAQAREVLPEDTVVKRPAQLGLPAVEVLARVGVDGLVDSAVVLHVIHPIAKESDLTGALRSRCGDGDWDWAVDGLLVDARRAQAVPRVGPGLPTLTESSFMGGDGTGLSTLPRPISSQPYDGASSR